jgi:hypothetical protein
MEEEVSFVHWANPGCRRMEGDRNLESIGAAQTPDTSARGIPGKTAGRAASTWKRKDVGTRRAEDGEDCFAPETSEQLASCLHLKNGGSRPAARCAGRVSNASRHRISVPNRQLTFNNKPWLTKMAMSPVPHVTCSMPPLHALRVPGDHSRVCGDGDGEVTERVGRVPTRSQMEVEMRCRDALAMAGSLRSGTGCPP